MRWNREVVTALAVVVAVGALAGPPAALASPAVTATTTYTSPGTYSFTVPAGVSSIDVTAVGAAGGSNGGCGLQGGQGATISGSIPVVAGEQLSVGVGAPGAADCFTSNASSIGGGGAGGPGAGSGGGASVLSAPQPSPGFQSLLIVAAGGGGGAVGSSGGGAGAAGANGPFDDGAGPGTATAGGAGGTDFSGGSNGSNGGFGVGGAGASFFNQDGGGGGGGGYYGGGGGGASIEPPFGSGGGGGSSFLDPQATATSGPTVTAASSGVSITYAVPTAEPGTSALSFGTVAQGSVSVQQAVTITNNGSAPLIVSGLEPGGADPGDYLITDGCQQPVAPGANCEIGVRFAPQAPGSSSASFMLLSNASAAAPIAVSGTGGPAAQGPAGPQGPTGATGSPGPRGPQGPAATIVCRNSSLARALCSLEFAPGSFSDQGAQVTAAYQIQHAGRMVARGTVQIKNGHLTIRQIGKLPRGRSTLIISDRQHSHEHVLLRLVFRVP